MTIVLCFQRRPRTKRKLGTPWCPPLAPTHHPANKKRPRTTPLGSRFTVHRLMDSFADQAYHYPDKESPSIEIHRNLSTQIPRVLISSAPGGQASRGRRPAPHKQQRAKNKRHREKMRNTKTPTPIPHTRTEESNRFTTTPFGASPRAGGHLRC